LIRRHQQINAFNEVKQNRRHSAVKVSRRVQRENEKHPNVGGSDDAKVKNYFPRHAFPQIKHPVNYDYRKLNYN
jgi:hypothetical protein